MSAVHFSSLSSAQLKLIPLHSSVAWTWISFQQQPKNQIFENCAPQLHSSSHWKASSREYSWRWRSRVSFFQSFLTKSPDVDSLKEELLEAIAPLDRGAEANPEDQERVDQVIADFSKFTCFDLMFLIIFSWYSGIHAREWWIDVTEIVLSFVPLHICPL